MGYKLRGPNYPGQVSIAVRSGMGRKRVGSISHAPVVIVNDRAHGDCCVPGAAEKSAQADIRRSNDSDGAGIIDRIELECAEISGTFDVDIQRDRRSGRRQGRGRMMRRFGGRVYFDDDRRRSNGSWRRSGR